MTGGRAFFVDPGKMTGYGFLEWGPAYGPVPRFYGGEVEHEKFLDWIAPRAEVLLDGRPNLRLFPHQNNGVSHIICEGFKITQRTSQTNPTHRELWSVQQLGVLEMYARWAGIPFFDPFPSAKTFDKDGSKLKKLGWWDPSPGVKGEKGHRRDAARHAVKWAVDHRIIPLEALL